MLEDLNLRRRYDGFLFLAEAARNPPVLRSHRHEELELNVVVRGTITYLSGSRRFTFGQRTLIWMFPSQEHQLVDRSGDAQYYVAVFKPALIRAACRGTGYRDLRRRRVALDGLLHAALPPESFDLVRRVMDTMVEDGLNPDILNREAGFGVSANFRFEHRDPDGLNAGLRHLLLLCWRYFRKEQQPATAVALHPAVSKAITLLSEDEWDQSFAALAGRCHVSEAYLSRIFKKQIGVPLNRYRNSARLGRFLELYRAPTQKTLAEAVYAAGFGSYAQFYKVFTQAYGRGPREVLTPRR